MGKLKKGADSESVNNPSRFSFQHIEPITKNQQRVFQEYREGKNLVLHGIAGTGKTFISMFLALEDVFNKDNRYDRISIVRSVVPTRDMGFLPGSEEEKTKVYEAPYISVAQELFGTKEAYNNLKTKKKLQFMSTSFIRGITFNNSIIIVDESQNMTPMELHSIMTRVGKNCKIIFCGDVRQNDLQRGSGLGEFIGVLRRMNNFFFIEFGVEDIVRSDLVKEYIIARYEQGLDW